MGVHIRGFLLNCLVMECILNFLCCADQASYRFAVALGAASGYDNAAQVFVTVHARLLQEWYGHP